MTEDLVVDASVAILLAQHPDDDPRSDVARRLMPLATQAYRLVAPALLGWELGNIVHAKRASTWPDAALRGRIVRGLLEDIDLDVPDDATWASTGHLAERLRLSYYDASYVDLAARRPGALLITEDERLRRAAAADLGRDRAIDLADLAALVE